VFAATLAGGEPRSSDERDSVRFFAPDELPDRMSEQDGDRIADALTGQERAVLRVQPSQGDEPPPAVTELRCAPEWRAERLRTLPTTRPKNENR
jgi:hypothetical protein